MWRRKRVQTLTLDRNPCDDCLNFKGSFSKTSYRLGGQVAFGKANASVPIATQSSNRNQNESEIDNRPRDGLHCCQCVYFPGLARSREQYRGGASSKRPKSGCG